MGFCCDKIPGRVKTLPYSGFYRIDKLEFMAKIKNTSLGDAPKGCLCKEKGRCG